MCDSTQNCVVVICMVITSSSSSHRRGSLRSGGAVGWTWSSAATGEGTMVGVGAGGSKVTQKTGAVMRETGSASRYSCDGRCGDMHGHVLLQYLLHQAFIQKIRQGGQKLNVKDLEGGWMYSYKH